MTLIIWGEIGVFFWSLSGCKWPDKQIASVASGAPPTHILLIADPHILPPHVHSQTWGQLFRDIYTRKSWAATRRMHPHAVVFLGDMLASGGSMVSDDEYAIYAHKFKDLFPLDPGVQVTYIPGNADVGLGRADAFTKHVRQRYERFFSPVNQHLSIANHSLVLLDAPGIVEEDYVRAGQGVSFDEWTPIQNGPVDFVKSLATERRNEPVVLFSHIPLHRSESKTCGPLREKGTIHRGVGKGWQKTLGKHTSTFVLESLRPVIVFSADDRDYCDITHTLPPTSSDPSREIHEITVKSFSRARHIQQPGFHLLSLQSSSQSHAHTPCHLPSAYGPLTRLYIPFACLTLMILLFAHMRRIRRLEYLRMSTASPTPTPLSSHTNLAHLVSTDPPSPYSASSAYSYSYAYTNTPPASSGRAYFDLPPSAGAGGLRTPAHDEHDDGDDNDIDGQYLYVPPAAGTQLDRRHLARTALASPPLARGALDPDRRLSWVYTFSFRGRRRRLAVHAPRWVGRLWVRAQMRSVRRGDPSMWQGVWGDMGRITGPTVLVWAALVWWFSR
ncbi:hypothetical protein BV25DRAFT_1830545 [Artomyces pyxidatus]|uniref:Uncharacterized protein n=1 Tax=Artomyces pyxidatus TaxID=48021 RepID=A0ACB8SQH4_9AGAM|nr:hypothetical protein BV25DRAFT_1830545 [Artomyces pyxidatus]